MWQLQHALKKVTPSFQQPPLKLEVLSSPPFLKICLEAQPPHPPPCRKGGGAHCEISLLSRQRGSKPLFYEDPPYIAYLPPPFSNFVHHSFIHPHLPLSCQSNPYSQLFFLSSCFFGWMGDHTFNVLFYLMIIWIYTIKPWNLSTRMTLFYATRH